MSPAVLSRAALPISLTALLLVSARHSRADSFSSYGRRFQAITMPPIASGSFGLVGDALPDGRLLALTGNDLYIETVAGSGAFVPGGRIDPAVVGTGGAGAVSDPAFLRVSPDGSLIAVGAGAGKPVIVFDAALVSTSAPPPLIAAVNSRVFRAPHTGGAWSDGNHLALTAGDFGAPTRVTLLDINSDPANADNRVLISNIGGASADIAFDGAGNLYTANGYDLDPADGSETGHLRAFAASEWRTAAAAGTPIDFESGGILVADLLSGAALRFDSEGNLFVGGFGDTDFGHAALVNADALRFAMITGHPVDADDASEVRFLAPTADPFAFYGAVYNAAQRTALITYTDFATGATTWYATVPAPSSAALLVPATVAFSRLRRRRS